MTTFQGLEIVTESHFELFGEIHGVILHAVRLWLPFSSAVAVGGKPGCFENLRHSFFQIHRRNWCPEM